MSAAFLLAPVISVFYVAVRVVVATKAGQAPAALLDALVKTRVAASDVR